MPVTFILIESIDGLSPNTITVSQTLAHKNKSDIINRASQHRNKRNDYQDRGTNGDLAAENTIRSRTLLDAVYNMMTAEEFQN